MTITNRLINNYKVLNINIESPVALILFLVKNGSRFESAEKQGLSHLIEHMMFKQTEKRSTHGIAMEIETIGGQTNAFTGQEYTGYYIKVLKENVNQAFEILSDIFQNGKFTNEDLEIEKGNVIEEIRMYEDSPSDLVWEVSQNEIFDDLTLGHSIPGTEQSVTGFKREDILSFLDSNYLQQDMLIVLAGDISDSQTEELILKNLKERKNGTLSIPETTFKPKSQVKFKEKQDGNQAHLVMSYQGTSCMDEEIMSYEVLSEILGGGMGSILFQLLREKLGIAYYVGSAHSDYVGTGTFQIYFGTNIDRTKEAVDKIEEEIKKLIAGKIDPDQIKRAQNLYYSSIAMAHENIGYLGRKYGIQLLIENKIETIEQSRERVFAVTHDKLVDIAKKIFSSERNITYIAPKELL